MVAIQRRNPIVTVLIAVFSLAVILSAHFASPMSPLSNLGMMLQNCDLDAELLTTSDLESWHIVDSTIPAKILWQKAERVQRPVTHIGSPNTGFVASKGMILYWQEGGGDSCDIHPIVVALDKNTGVEKWRYRPQDLVTEIFAVSDGFVLLNVLGVVKLNWQGQVVWKQGSIEDIPFRAFNTMHEQAGILYFSAWFGGATYKLASDTGNLIGSEAIGDVMSLFDNFALLKVGETRLQLVDSSKNNKIHYTIDLSKDLFKNGYLNSLYPVAIKHRDTLFLFYESKRVEVYDFNTGQALWQLEKPIYGIPAFSSDDLLILYSRESGLELYRARTGELLGNVKLVRDSSSQNTSDQMTLFSVWIAADENTVYIRQRDYLELLAIEIDLSTIEQ
ncbi:MAG TPA: hypothetical protein VHO69_06545 [Phototrophicaceae bacterium]|nr:hypothetical protein [Phototrophicaceae bacterium]